MAIKMSKKTNKVQKVVKKAPKSVVSKTTSQASKAPAKIPTGQFTEAVGRRKVATARVRIYEGTGDFVVNSKVAGDYFNSIRNASTEYMKPFDLTGTKGKFAVSAKISGSGPSAQLDALIHGIARALVKYNGEFRVFLKEAGLLTRDDRMKETRKIGMGGKARRSRQSPKR